MLYYIGSGLIESRTLMKLLCGVKLLAMMDDEGLFSEAAVKNCECAFLFRGQIPPKMALS